jgi:putative hemolysin
MLLALAACTSAAPPAEQATAPAATSARGSTEIDASACAAQGGTIRPVCRRQLPVCVIAYPDAGKTCTDDSGCVGKCLYKGDTPPTTAGVTGQCQANSDPCGCRSEVNGGKVTATLCVD